VRSTGDELLAPGDAPLPGRVYDANATTLAALLGQAGADVHVGKRLPDDITALRATLRATDADVIVVSGGASAGDKDLLVDAVRAEGELLFHGVRVKPGKPLLAGRVGRALLVGLPGNPTSALSDAAIFLVPALRQMAGLPLTERVTTARLASDVRGEPDRYLFLPVRLEGGVAKPTFKGSSALTSLAGSDGWIGVDEGATLPAGTGVEVHGW
jgi:molybdenum cofactor synthesis domain-containing protein